MHVITLTQKRGYEFNGYPGKVISPGWKFVCFVVFFTSSGAYQNKPHHHPIHIHSFFLDTPMYIAMSFLEH